MGIMRFLLAALCMSAQVPLVPASRIGSTGGAVTASNVVDTHSETTSNETASTAEVDLDVGMRNGTMRAEFYCCHWKTGGTHGYPDIHHYQVRQKHTRCDMSDDWSVCQKYCATG